MVGPAIWVADAAQFYLPAGTNGLLRPFWHPDREVRNSAFVAAHWSLLSLESKLPDSIDFFYDEAGWDKALRRGQKQSSSTNRSDEPIPVATYQSVGKTNLGRWAFPIQNVFTAKIKRCVATLGRARFSRCYLLSLGLMLPTCPA